jgi:hypothetical protein
VERINRLSDEYSTAEAFRSVFFLFVCFLSECSHHPRGVEGTRAIPAI